MKGVEKVLAFLSVLGLLFSMYPVSYGQNRESAQQEDSGKLFFEAQLTEIKKQVKMDGYTAKRFTYIYRKYYSEMENQRMRYPRGERPQLDTLSDKTAEYLIVTQINEGRAYLNIREKYYNEFKKILSPKDIYRVFRIEQDIHRKIIQEYKRRNK